MSLLEDWFNMPEGVLRGLSEMGITTHWIILQYTIGLLFITILMEAVAYKMNDKHIMKMARSISKVALIIFVFGALTGSLSEFGLLLFWPNFLELVGEYYFIPLFLEVFMFMAEVVFVYMYYYTWERVGRKFHLIIGVLAVLGVFGSALLIMSVNTLMSYPPGLQATYDATTGLWTMPEYLLYNPDGTSQIYTSGDIRNIIETDVDQYHAILGATVQEMGVFGIVFQSPGAVISFLHATTAAVNVSVYSIIGIYSYRYLKYRNYAEHKEYYFKGIKLFSMMATSTMMIQGIVGHAIGANMAKYNPEKLAAMEGTSDTIWSFGQLPLVEPVMNWLSYGDFDAHILDYDTIPTEFQPPLIIHYVYYFKIMMATALFGITLITLFFMFKRDVIPDLVLKASISFPFVIQLVSNFGWITREAGRKPWTIYGILTVDEAARETPVTGIYFFLVVVYCLVLLGGMGFLIKKLNKMSVDESELAEKPEKKASEEEA
ncbi:MAG: cytochrome ubiquinol oxidase subunit I [Candidatus Heimdallarchaeota archaeon]|nr:cytochrome ubiquinol oxidase subunit I [Candidatus Heimdallarchaeota archaeon]